MKSNIKHILEKNYKHTLTEKYGIGNVKLDLTDHLKFKLFKHELSSY